MPVITNPGQTNLTPHLFIPRNGPLLGSSDETIRNIATNFLAIQNWADMVLAGAAGGVGLRFATKVVAASDSLDTNPAHYDYLCTGVNDTLTIQAAINALPAFGGKVLLMEGHYYLATNAVGANDTAQIVLRSGVTLEGMGPSTVLLKKPGISAGSTWLIGQFDVSTGISIQNCVVCNLTLDGNMRGDGSVIGDGAHFGNGNFDRILFSQVRFVDMYHGGVQLVNAQTGTRFTMESCWAGQGANNPNLFKCSNANIDQIALRNNVCQASSGIVLDNGTTIEVTDNILISPDGLNYGIYLNSIAEATIAGNSIVGFLRGIFLDGPNCVRNRIDGNRISQSQREGIDVQGANDNQIVNNYVNSSSQATNNTYDDITLERDGTPVGANNNYVADNVCRFGGFGTQARYGLNIINAACNTNTTVNNDLHGSGATGAYNDTGTGTLKNLDGSANNWNRM